MKHDSSKPLRMARAGVALALALGALLGSAQALAENPNYNTDSFRPSPHQGDLLGVETSHTPKHMQYAGGALFTWNNKPLSLHSAAGAAITQLVARQLAGDLYGSIGLLNYLSVGLNVPLFLYSAGDVAPARYGLSEVGGFSLGDLRLGVKGTIIDAKGAGFGLAVSEDLSLPTATGDDFNGDGFLATTRVIGDYAFKGWRAAANLGMRLRPGGVTVLGRDIGNELLYGLAGEAPILCGTVEAIGALEGRTALGDPFGSKYDNALDLLLGGRLHVGDIAVSGAAGGGLLAGSGSPTFRATLGVAFAPQNKGACIVDGDKDGVADELDRCPTVAGRPALKGCPDKDADGVADIDDRCPDKQGQQAFKGCPDSDGDGFADPDDKCPKEAGPEFGCPPADTDKDGVPDPQDRCPNEPGPKENNGCPVVIDKDGDGILDPQDKCPDKRGVKEFGGCPPPDKDGDGIPDALDKCPDLPGLPAKQGCPEARVVVTQEAIVITERVFFATRKDTPLKESLPLLDEVANVIKAHPAITKVRVEGHTDNVGAPAKNLKLSDDRAKAVMKYLIKSGVAAGRLEYRGYGDTRPIAPNEGDDGNPKNRRVEFKILERK